MIEHNLALQNNHIETDSKLDIKIGNSKYSDDIWDLSPFMPVKTTQYSQKLLRFGSTPSCDRDCGPGTHAPPCRARAGSPA